MIICDNLVDGCMYCMVRNFNIVICSYKNAYCARCNGVSTARLKFWKCIVDCKQEFQQDPDTGIEGQAW